MDVFRTLIASHGYLPVMRREIQCSATAKTAAAENPALKISALLTVMPR